MLLALVSASSMAPLHCLGQDNQNNVQHDFFCLCDANGFSAHTVMSMESLHSLGQDNQNEVQHYFFAYVMSMASLHSLGQDNQNDM